MPFDPSWPPTNAELESAPFRNQFNALKALIDALQAQVNAQQSRMDELLPIGIMVGWAKNLGAMPALPGTWVECNGQVLSDSESPLDGVTLPDGNSGKFLRGAAVSGGTGGSDSHAHTVDLSSPSAGDPGSSGGSTVQNDIYPTSDASNLPPYYEVVWVMRIR